MERHIKEFLNFSVVLIDLMCIKYILILCSRYVCIRHLCRTGTYLCIEYLSKRGFRLAVMTDFRNLSLINLHLHCLAYISGRTSYFDWHSYWPVTPDGLVLLSKWLDHRYWTEKWCMGLLLFRYLTLYRVSVFDSEGSWQHHKSSYPFVIHSSLFLSVSLILSIYLSIEFI